MQVRLQVAGGAGGASQWVSLEAANPEDAMRQARRSGYSVLAVAGDAAREPVSSGGSLALGRRFPLLLFTQELIALLDAGLNVLEALQTLRRKERQRAAARVLDGLLASLDQGLSLSDAMQAEGAVFPLIYVAAVRASERTGGLLEALRRYAAYQRQLDELRRGIVSASIYPVLLLGVAALVVLFLLGFVVPRYGEVLKSAQRELAGASAWLFALGLWVAERRVEVFGSIAALAALFGAALWRPDLRRWMLASLLSVWPLRGYAEDHARARFYRTLAVLLDTGTPLPKGMQMCAELLPDGLRSDLELAIQGVRSGLPFSEAMAGTRLLTPISESLLRAGERSGGLSKMLERSAAFLEEELARSIDTLSRLLGPVLVLLTGLFIAWIVVVMYLQFASYPQRLMMR